MLNSTRKNKGSKIRAANLINVKLINHVSNEEYVGDIIGEDTIDGKTFWIMKVGARVFKLAKEGFELKTKIR